MKITIETTPQELAELIFNLVDADFEVDDDEEEEFDEERKLTAAEVADIVMKSLHELNHKTAT